MGLVLEKLLQHLLYSKFRLLNHKCEVYMNQQAVYEIFKLETCRTWDHLITVLLHRSGTPVKASWIKWKLKWIFHQLLIITTWIGVANEQCFTSLYACIPHSCRLLGVFGCPRAVWWREGRSQVTLFIHSKRTTFLTSNPRRLGKGAAMGFKWFATIKMIPLPS